MIMAVIITRKPCHDYGCNYYQQPCLDYGCNYYQTTLNDTIKGDLREVTMALAAVELSQQVEEKPYEETQV